jgi:hypothetical protein
VMVMRDIFLPPYLAPDKGQRIFIAFAQNLEGGFNEALKFLRFQRIHFLAV